MVTIIPIIVGTPKLFSKTWKIVWGNGKSEKKNWDCPNRLEYWEFFRRAEKTCYHLDFSENYQLLREWKTHKEYNNNNNNNKICIRKKKNLQASRWPKYGKHPPTLLNNTISHTIYSRASDRTIWLTLVHLVMGHSPSLFSLFLFLRSCSGRFLSVVVSLQIPEYLRQHSFSIIHSM